MPVIGNHRQTQTAAPNLYANNPLAGYANNPLAGYANNPVPGPVRSAADLAQADERDSVLGAFDTQMPDTVVAPAAVAANNPRSGYANNPSATYSRRIAANAPPAVVANNPLGGYANNPRAANPAANPLSNYGQRVPAPGGGGAPAAAALAPAPNNPFRQTQAMAPGSVGEDQRTNADDARGVRYYYDPATRREKFKVEIAARLTRRGQIFDTAQLSQHFRSKGTQTSAPTLGRSRTGAVFQTPNEWLYDSAIWVCAADENNRPAFYSHICRRGRFHHSSMIGGGEVIGAGEWIVQDGRLKSISANSGHYQPTLDFLYRAILGLAAAFQPDTTVFLYDSRDDQWVYRRITEFVARPHDGGRYQAHPRAGAGRWDR